MRFLLLLLSPLIAIGQKNCAGFVVDKLTTKGVPYATIGLLKENKGVSANEQGAFSINSSFPKVDSLRITSVGYKAQVVPVAGWVDGKTIELLPEENLLQGVMISANNKREEYVLNRFGHCSWNWYWIGLETIYQRAQLFEAPKQEMQLTKLEMCKDGAESIFHFRIYDVDSACQCPSKDLADTVIEVRSKEKHVRINLEEYNIFIPGKKFFVAVEWLFIPFNEDLQTRKQNGRKIEITFYKPAMRWVTKRDTGPGHVWELNFWGGWSQVHASSQNDNFQITATLR